MQVRMNLLIIIGVLVVVDARRYSSKHDNIDIDRLVRSPLYMEESAACYLDRRPCSKMTATLKRAIPEIVNLACGKCTPAQKYILRRYLEELKKQRPEDYAAFRHKYDPDNVYFVDLEAAISVNKTDI
ncbi:ejaculatory bulb-specific protein 3 [Plodia interpunctella]|uniref:ejaculatory bulb-specific protein 3 n=1 Tax=Plodia interpunctella TaxID=58824 RepID=UPI0023689904|nr:ejaculatory bulb-specific protein 3-like [Plodia interpunctella]